MQEIEDRPQVLRRVFERRARQHQPVFRLDHLAGLRVRRIRIFYMLRFVENQIFEADFLQKLRIAPGEAV